VFVDRKTFIETVHLIDAAIEGGYTPSRAMEELAGVFMREPIHVGESVSIKVVLVVIPTLIGTLKRKSPVMYEDIKSLMGITNETVEKFISELKDGVPLPRDVSIPLETIDRDAFTVSIFLASMLIHNSALAKSILSLSIYLYMNESIREFASSIDVEDFLRKSFVPSPTTREVGNA